MEETEALSRRAAKLDVREAELEQRAVEVDERVEALARGDQVRDRLEQAPVLLRELDARERALEERERQLDVGERFVLRERTRLEEVAERARELEERLRERESDLVRLDQAATEAAAAWEAEVELRNRQLRRAESSVEERERRITAREDALARYVREAQAARSSRADELTRRPTRRPRARPRRTCATRGARRRPLAGAERHRDLAALVGSGAPAGEECEHPVVGRDHDDVVRDLVRCALRLPAVGRQVAGRDPPLIRTIPPCWSARTFASAGPERTPRSTSTAPIFRPLGPIPRGRPRAAPP